jgi:hypothetical protein
LALDCHKLGLLETSDFALHLLFHEQIHSLDIILATLVFSRRTIADQRVDGTPGNEPDKCKYVIYELLDIPIVEKYPNIIASSDNIPLLNFPASAVRIRGKSLACFIRNRKVNKMFRVTAVMMTTVCRNPVVWVSGWINKRAITGRRRTEDPSLTRRRSWSDVDGSTGSSRCPIIQLDS